MGPSALPACERKRTLDSRSGAVAAKKNCATMRYNCISVASSIILKRKVVNTRHRVMTSRKFHLSLKYLCGEAYQRHGMVLVKQKENRQDLPPGAAYAYVLGYRGGSPSFGQDEVPP